MCMLTTMVEMEHSYLTAEVCGPCHRLCLGSKELWGGVGKLGVWVGYSLYHGLNTVRSMVITVGEMELLPHRRGLLSGCLQGSPF